MNLNTLNAYRDAIFKISEIISHFPVYYIGEPDLNKQSVSKQSYKDLINEIQNISSFATIRNGQLNKLYDELALVMVSEGNEAGERFINYMHLINNGISETVLVGNARKDYKDLLEFKPEDSMKAYITSQNIANKIFKKEPVLLPDLCFYLLHLLRMIYFGGLTVYKKMSSPIDSNKQSVKHKIPRLQTIFRDDKKYNLFLDAIKALGVVNENGEWTISSAKAGNLFASIVYLKDSFLVKDNYSLKALLEIFNRELGTTFKQVKKEGTFYKESFDEITGYIRRREKSNP